ncbi:hypothetical protein PHYC_00856 [Phycisphaerales bacterium]|nr:hypothetical protein PHYC_00856 [Phycisphaerales bacterium]
MILPCILAAWSLIWPTAPDPPLAGPTAAPAAATSTLVEVSFNGEVKPTEVPPEEAALQLLRLDAPDATEVQRQAHAAAQGILAARAKFIDDFVVDNIPLLTMFGNAENTGDKFDQLMLAIEAMRKFRPLHEKGPLQQRIAGVLPEPDRERFDTLLGEYRAALVADRHRRPKADGKRPGRIEIVLTSKLESFGREVERSFQRVLYSGDLVYRYATRGLKLTREQQRRLRELTSEHAAKGENATEADNRRLFGRAILLLDEEQRPRFIKNLKGL